MAKTYKIAAAEEKTFSFQPPRSKKVYSVPLLTNLPLSQLLKAQKYYKDIDGDDDFNVLEFFEFLSEIFEPYAPGVIETLKVEEAAFLFKAYQDASSEDGTIDSPVGE